VSGVSWEAVAPEALTVKFEDYDISEISQLTLERLAESLQGAAGGKFTKGGARLGEEKADRSQRIARTILDRVATLGELGLGYLSLDRSTPTLSPGELQRLRLATQIRSNLFGVV